MKFSGGRFLGIFPIGGKVVPVAKLVPALTATRPLLDGSESEEREVGLKDAWKQLARNEAFTARELEKKLLFSLAAASRRLLKARERLTLRSYTEGKLSSRDAFEEIGDLEARHRNDTRVAGNRLGRLEEIRKEKERLYEELAQQAAALAVNQRALTDHHLGMTDSPSLDSPAYPYELYRGAYSRLRERIEAAYQEGRKENRMRRRRLETAARHRRALTQGKWRRSERCLK